MPPRVTTILIVTKSGRQEWLERKIITWTQPILLQNASDTIVLSKENCPQRTQNQR